MNAARGFVTGWGRWVLGLALVVWFTGGAAQAAVQLLPEAVVTVEGQSAGSTASALAAPSVKELLAAFGEAEQAVGSEDLDGLMQFYAAGFNYHGLKLPDVRRIWSEVFEHYRGVSSTHLFSEIHVIREGQRLRAEMTCTGGLYGTERKTGRPITLDSWFREVHYLVKERGAWRFIGNAGHAPTVAPFSSVPHHPLF